jgi:hypothetical protein
VSYKIKKNLNQSLWNSGIDNIIDVNFKIFLVVLRACSQTAEFLLNTRFIENTLFTTTTFSNAM